MVKPVLRFWFDFASTYSYLSAMRIEEAAGRSGVEVVWEPFLLGPIFAAQGWTDSPFNIYPAKGRYMWRDMERRCADLDLPFNRPSQFPQNSLQAARVAMAVKETNRLSAFCKAVYSAQFAEGKNISDPVVLQSCLTSAGLDPSQLEQAQTAQVKSALRQQVERATELDLFGAPSFTLGSELFWGDDQLDDALRFASDQADSAEI